MTWFILALIPPILWAVVNHIDHYLLSKASHESSVNVLMVYSTTFAVFVLPVLWFFSDRDLFSDWHQAFIQIIGGILITLSIYFYLLALNKDETSNIVPLFLLTPVFGYILSYFTLGEILTGKQLVSCIIIVVGALILSLEFNEESKLRVKHTTLMIMAVCTFFQATQEVLFKFVTIENSVFTSMFWLEIGILIYGIILLSTHKGLWGEFVKSIQMNGKTIFGVNFLSEGMSTTAYLIRDYAMLFVPITLVMSLNGYQPAFVFILGVILTIFKPEFAEEKIKPIHLIHKTLAIGIMIAGTYMITQTIS